MKQYYALEQIYGNISPASNYGAPILHVFKSKECRDSFVKHYIPESFNHSAYATTSKIAYKYYSHVKSGVREFCSIVVFH